MTEALIIFGVAHTVIVLLAIYAAHNSIQKQLTKGETKLMAGVVDVQNSETTLHADLVAENGLIKQLLAAFAAGTLTPAQAQALVDQMDADDADAKSNVAAITAALPPA